MTLDGIEASFELSKSL